MLGACPVYAAEMSEMPGENIIDMNPETEQPDAALPEGTAAGGAAEDTTEGPAADVQTRDIQDPTEETTDAEIGDIQEPTEETTDAEAGDIQEPSEETTETQTDDVQELLAQAEDTQGGDTQGEAAEDTPVEDEPEEDASMELPDGTAYVEKYWCRYVWRYCIDIHQYCNRK